MIHRNLVIITINAEYLISILFDFKVILFVKGLLCFKLYAVTVVSGGKEVGMLRKYYVILKL